MLNYNSLVNLFLRSALILNASGLAVTFGNCAFAQIQPDTTLGSENSIVNDIDALNKRIDGGVKLDANLFHSFREFNVSEGGSVYFANPEGISDIFSRVTGNNPSNIFGKLGVLGDANLFLINPNGIVFGENASLDVGGSFVASTANGIEFGEQGVFSASNPETPQLLNVNPSALFFNQIAAQPIENKSRADAGRDPSNSFDTIGLRVPDGKSLLLIGGNVNMDGGKLNAYGGRVELGGLAAPGSINLLFEGDNLKLGFPENVTRADVSLTNQAFVRVEADGDGDIAINARNLDILQGSQLSTGIGRGLGTPDAVAGDILLNATGEIKVAGIGSNIYNTVRLGAEGNGGSITIDSASFLLQDGAQFITSTFGIGNAGNVQVTARDAVSLAGNAYILSTVQAGSDGQGGNIDINAATFSLTDGSQLQTIIRGASDTQSAGIGNAGNVNVKVSEAVDIAGRKNGFVSGIFSFVGTGAEGNGGNITIDSGSFSLGDGAGLAASTLGIGNAGNVQVKARDAVSLAGNALILSTVEAGGDGQGGNIDIKAAKLSLTDSARLQASTFGKGNAGNVNVKVNGLVHIAGEKNGLYSRISSAVATGAEGNGGNITIDSGSFLLEDGARLQASTFGIGDAGNVKLTTTDTVSLARNALILSTVEAGGKGEGGDIDVNASTLTLQEGAQLLTLIRGRSYTDTQPAVGRGNAGNVNVRVSGLVDIAGENGLYSGIYSVADTGTVGNAGNITIDSGSLSLRDGALINARTKTDYRGGDVIVNTDIFEAFNGGQLVAITSGNGSAGKITVNASKKTTISGSDPNYDNRLVQLPDYVPIIGANSGLFVNSSGSGDTGDIELNSPQITLDNQGTFNANSASGNGGNINLTSDLLLMRRSAQISTNAGTAQQGGDGGNININSKFIVAPSQENSDITANAFSGTGGNVEIISQGIFGIEPRDQQTDRSDITASSELGVPGNLNLTDPDDSSIRNNLSDLPDNQIDTNTIIANSCIVRSNEQNGTFLITGSGGLPQNPSDAPLSSYSTGSIRSIPSNSEKSPASNRQSWKIGDPVVEPQGVYKLPNGQLVLSRECN